MKLKNLIYTAVCTILSIASTSCSDYLDISGEFNASLTRDEVWENPTYTKNWYGTIYNNLMEYSETGSEMNAFKNPWSNLCGEISSQKGSSRDVMVSGFTAASGEYHRWASMYKNIRQAMLFIENAHDEGVGDAQSRISAEEIARMKDEARFMMAYYYFSIFELYGPCPIVEKIDDAAYPEVYYYERATVDQMVDFIDGILKNLCDPETSKLAASVITAASGTDYTFNTNEVVRPTIVTAKALRAKLAMFAASKLFNGGDGSEYYTELQKIENGRGEKIFPQSYDPNKWQIAKERVWDLISYAEDKGHSLYTVLVNGINQPHQSVYKLFQIYNQEILWCSTNNSYSDQYKMEKRTNPRDVNSCYGTIGPSQESVDMFFTKNGLTIKEDPNYEPNKLVTVKNYANNETASGRDDKNVLSMYSDREPRFYADVIYQGKSWFDIFMNKSGNSNYFVDFSRYGGAGPSNSDNPNTGYLLGKFKNRNINHAGSDLQKYSRVSILYRLAEFYLFYAEACNEVNPNDPNIIKYIDLVRERAGIPGYAQLAEEGKKDIRGDYDKQFDAIQRERFVELFCEGQRYFDIRRWMICGPGQAADQTLFSGMNMQGTTDKAIGSSDSYYKVIKLENRQWNDKLYLYPIHQNVIELGKGGIPQNAGW